MSIASTSVPKPQNSLLFIYDSHSGLSFLGPLLCTVFQIFCLNNYWALHHSHSSVSDRKGNSRDTGIWKLGC